MNPKFKSLLIVVAKQAVNAVITNAGLATMFRQTFGTHSLAGWLNMGKAALVVILAREIMVWGPKVFAWSTSPTKGADVSTP